MGRIHALKTFARGAPIPQENIYFKFHTIRSSSTHHLSLGLSRPLLRLFLLLLSLTTILRLALLREDNSPKPRQ